MLPEEVVKAEPKIISFLKWLNVDIINKKDEHLLLQTFIHKSYAADFKEILDNNERLEFLWDGILWALICKLLFINNKDMSEGEMSLYKIALVREEILAEIALDIKLDTIIFISKWEEKTGGREKKSILSDCLEALIWYIYIDLGIEEVEKFIINYVYIKKDKVSKKPIKSYKSMVQEITQKDYKELPEYQDFEQKGNKKWKTAGYRTEIYVLGKKMAEGIGDNKKSAQEEAAKNYYKEINTIS